MTNRLLPYHVDILPLSGPVRLRIEAALKDQDEHSYYLGIEEGQKQVEAKYAKLMEAIKEVIREGCTDAGCDGLHPFRIHSRRCPCYLDQFLTGPMT